MRDNTHTDIPFPHPGLKRLCWNDREGKFTELTIIADVTLATHMGTYGEYTVDKYIEDVRRGELNLWMKRGTYK